jgi:hypothetical protein
MVRAAARLGAAMIFLTAALGIRPAAAADGCVAMAPATSATTTVCTYTASQDGSYVAAVNGTWTITRKHGTVTTTVATNNQPQVGAIPAQTGDLITVRIDDGAGALVAGEQ